MREKETKTGITAHIESVSKKLFVTKSSVPLQCILIPHCEECSNIHNAGWQT